MSKTLIIGGGVAGLCAGVHLLRDGEEAVICEREAKAGGNLTGWDRGGFHIDNCIHWLTGTNPASSTYALWETLGMLGEGVRVVQKESLYTCRLGGESLSLYRDADRLCREMIRISPADEKRVRAFISDVKLLQRLFGVGGETHDRSCGRLEKVMAIPRLYKYYRMSAGELAREFTHPLLREFICALLTEDFGALALICVFAHFCAGNADLPEGGSEEAARRMEQRFRSLGGILLTRAGVKRIVTDGRRAVSAVLEDGRELFFDQLIYTGDPAAFFGPMINARMPRKLAQRYSDRKLFRFSARQCAFACRGRELPFEGDVCLRVAQKYRQIIHGDRLALREFSWAPGFAPAGANVLQALVFCDAEQARDIIELSRDRAAYCEMKREFARAVTDLIEEALPSLDGRLECLDVWTPATYRDRTGAPGGSFMSFAFGPGVLPSELPCTVDGFDNVLLATQWLGLPGGLPVAAACGKAAAQEILRARRAPSRAHAGEAPLPDLTPAAQ